MSTNSLNTINPNALVETALSHSAHSKILHSTFECSKVDSAHSNSGSFR